MWDAKVAGESKVAEDSKVAGNSKVAGDSEQHQRQANRTSRLEIFAVPAWQVPACPCELQPLISLNHPGRAASDVTVQAELIKVFLPPGNGLRPSVPSLRRAAPFGICADKFGIPAIAEDGIRGVWPFKGSLLTRRGFLLTK